MGGRLRGEPQGLGEAPGGCYHAPRRAEGEGGLPRFWEPQRGDAAQVSLEMGLVGGGVTGCAPWNHGDWFLQQLQQLLGLKPPPSQVAPAPKPLPFAPWGAEGQRVVGAGGTVSPPAPTFGGPPPWGGDLCACGAQSRGRGGSLPP